METQIVSVEKELQDRIAKLDVLQKKSLLELIKSFVRKDNEEMKPQTIEEYNKELEEAESEYQKGEFISHAEMLNEIKKW